MTNKKEDNSDYEVIAKKTMGFHKKGTPLPTRDYLFLTTLNSQFNTGTLKT
jgi:hypothetical protein